MTNMFMRICLCEYMLYVQYIYTEIKGRANYFWSYFIEARILDVLKFEQNFETEQILLS